MNESIRAMSSIITRRRSRQASGDTTEVPLGRGAKGLAEAGVVFGEVHGAAEEVGQAERKPREREQGHAGAGVEIHKNVDVAVGTVIAAGDGAKERQRANR